LALYKFKKKTVMKKTVLTLMSIIALASSSFSQVNSKGSIIVDPYYGYPNFGKTFLSAINNATSEIKTVGIGPCGARAEYMLADKFGMGVDFIYNSMSGTYSIDSLNVDNTVYASYDTKLAMQRYRVQLRMNYHFTSSDNLDAYVGFGAGSNIRRFVYSSDKPNSAKESESGSLLPFSMRIALGMRYYFTNNIGFNAELGLGGPMVSAGLSLRF
jgi:opacity protein-like surface antigen